MTKSLFFYNGSYDLNINERRLTIAGLSINHLVGITSLTLSYPEKWSHHEVKAALTCCYFDTKILKQAWYCHLRKKNATHMTSNKSSGKDYFADAQLSWEVVAP